jgi:hypothetical protein
VGAPRSRPFRPFSPFLIDVLGVDAPKARRHGILWLSRLAINGRKRSKNGAKAVFSPAIAESSPDQRRLFGMAKIDEHR